MRILRQRYETGARMVVKPTSGRQVAWVQTVDGKVDVRKITTRADAFEPPKFDAAEVLGVEQTLEQLADEVAGQCFPIVPEGGEMRAFIGEWPGGKAALAVTASAQ